MCGCHVNDLTKQEAEVLRGAIIIERVIGLELLAASLLEC